MSYPPISAAEARAQATFAALLWAFSHPGRVRGLPADDAFAAIAECLLDLETSFYCADPGLNRHLVLTGARAAAPGSAHYLFYPRLHDRDLDELGAAPSGSYLYPDDGATLVLGCDFRAAGQAEARMAGQRLALSGPGIPAQVEESGGLELLIGGLPAAFWPLRAEKIMYPQGWDVVLVCGTQVLGLPRTTVVEAL